ncbi:MAG: serine hydroxymethyltransferase [Planctomycetota bacterium]
MDQEIHAAIRAEEERERSCLELIASENFVSSAVLEAQGSLLTNKYAEGYAGARWYGGCEKVDIVERAAVQRAKELFNAQHANVQPHAGSQANMAVYFSVLSPGDRILSMELSHGGHLTHGLAHNFSGRLFEIHHYGVRRDTEVLDMDDVAQTARRCRPKLIVAGASNYSRTLDFPRFREIADEVDAFLMVDMAHIAGLIAAGEHPSPVPYAHFVSGTTHKTLRGPRGGLILCREDFAKSIDAQIFPGLQGGPLMHAIAAKAVALKEAMHPNFKKYSAQVRKNTAALCRAFQQRGYRIVSGGTDNHLFTLDVGAKGLTGKEVEWALGQAGVTVNKNLIPYDTRPPKETSGVRIGAAALTTRGMTQDDMARIADWIHSVIERKDEPAFIASVQKKVRAFALDFPLHVGVWEM